MNYLLVDFLATGSNASASFASPVNLNRKYLELVEASVAVEGQQRSTAARGQVPDIDAAPSSVLVTAVRGQGDVVLDEHETRV